MRHRERAADGGGRGEGRCLLALLALPALLSACWDAPESREHAAAGRAVECLIEAASEMDPLWSVTTFDRLYKIAPTEEQASRIKRIFDDAMATPVATVPEELGSHLLEPSELQLITIELWRRRMTGAAWEEQAAALEAHLAEREDEFWQGTPPTQQLVLLHLLKRIDVETRRTPADVAAKLRGQWRVGGHERLVSDIRFMYPLTHVIYVDSGYGDRFLDPADYPIEVDVLDAALSRYAADFPTHPMFIHLASEVVASRRFLQLPDDEAARAVKRELLERQGESGCWRPDSGTETIHATREAVHALGRFPRELRSLERPQ